MSCRLYLQGDTMKMINQPLNISDICYGPVIVSRLAQRQDAYESGHAFRSHTKSAHNGKEDTTCRACQELKARIILS